MTEQVVDAVRKAASFLERNRCWHMIVANTEALSCRDAANKRYRLGKTGIPLEDELKSYLGKYIGRDGGIHYLAVHCRGDQLLDMKKVIDVVGAKSPVERAGAGSEGDEKGDFYGLVNPFTLSEGYHGHPVTQIFDAAILEHRGLPNTMMTNAGDRSWAIEFKPADVIRALGEKATVADVTETPAVRREGTIPIGIITGNAPDSGIILWRQINRRVQEVLGRRFQGDLSYPPVSVRSVPGLGLSMELDKRTEQVWEQLEPAVRSLCEEGVRLLCLACHTTHYFTDRIRAITDEHGATFISVAETVVDWVRHNNVPELTLVGINYVAELGEWSAYRPLADIAKVEPLTDEGLQRIHELGYQVKQMGSNEAGINKLRSILSDEARTSHVVIALTELSILLEAQKKAGKSGRVIVDALKIYGDQIADAYLGLANPREL